MVEIINSLLNEVKKISDKYENKKLQLLETAKKTGCDFNIFEIIGISTKEVYICRLLAELLDPNGSHCQGSKYLDLFCKRFLPDKKIDTKKVSVKKEDLTKQLEDEGKDKRRIDIVINEKEGHYIPIEVKINADEQLDQCHDYLEQAKRYYEQRKINKKPFVCFLTKTGYIPKSIKNSEKNQIICISWSDIYKWIEECIKISGDRTPIVEVLKQFEVIIKEYKEVSMENTEKILNYTRLNDVTNKEEIIELAKNLKEGKDKLINALKLYPAYLKAMQDIWVDFAKRLEEYLKEQYDKEPKNQEGKHWYLTYDLPNNYSVIIQSNARTELSSEDRLPTISIDVYKNEKKQKEYEDKYKNDLPTLFELVDNKAIEEHVKLIGDWLSNQYTKLSN